MLNARMSVQDFLAVIMNGWVELLGHDYLGAMDFFLFF